MGLTLTTHDTAFSDPDVATIAKVLASLDGTRHVLATLGSSELTYLQASGSVQTGFALEYQEDSLDRHYRSQRATLPLDQVTEIFQAYARGDAAWGQGVPWEQVPYAPPKTSWTSTWIGFALILATVIGLIWYWIG